MRRLLLPLLAALALAGCGGDDESPSEPAPTRPTVTIGTKNFPEQFLLGELYSQALESRGFRVVLKKDIGSTEIIHRALRRGTLDLYPEYIGVLATEIAGLRRPDSAEHAYEEAKAFEEENGFTMLEQTPFENRDALAVTPRYARRHDLDSVADLGRIDGRVRVGGPPEFRTRFEGLVGLEEVYGLDNLRFVPITIGEQYKALDDGDIDAADVFTTDGELERDRYVVLEDPENVFGFQHVAPVVNSRVLRQQGEGFARTMNEVSKLLTTDAMRQMNAAILGGQEPNAVADRFLRENGLK